MVNATNTTTSTTTCNFCRSTGKNNTSDNPSWKGVSIDPFVFACLS
jgi:hypothetical protein